MKFLLFLGTVRESAPPRPARLGVRVAKACLECLGSRYSEHEVELVDSLDYPLEKVFKPHFAYAKGQAPVALEALAEKIASADGYIMVSPEYNHSMSPALANLLNHFGSSLFSYKPSVIVTYSAGQWGGMRAAVGMRTFLSELGCLPVSAMIHVPKAQEVFAEDGAPKAGEDKESWFDYFSRAFNQMVWWGQAARAHRAEVDPHEMVGDFRRDPSQRNAPG
ncbi:NAD(P)H-dependent oxidoreductase [Microbulbifer thermotolerans]|uniref:NADPH-dependent FMN reductase n=1 Tax=Microbulbifer thermotolerans TaxID=252514 RepID=UPI0022499922|nr:NAD(P)H-dependent oxidoreductase [Microbulbifer thermotolerans]MCX2784378.1 NAD(P)H-dependent oxidoreductase [Microbulbifer thermotolerans]MCX2793646.1 NAD(P)H-dependent oxidoreductase [Microbulbifer thermotolerans]